MILLLFPSLFPFLLTSGESPTSTYDQIKVCGDLTIDELTFENTDIPYPDVWDYGLAATPTWTGNTILLMPFELNFDAGNFPTLDLPVTEWHILRRVTGDTQFTEIAVIPNDNTNIYYDTTASSDISYEYGVLASSNGTKSSGIISEAISINFFGWRLSSLDYNELTSTGTLYSFEVMNEMGAITPTQARTVHQNTFAPKPTIEYGAMQFRSGNLKTMPYSCNGEDIEIASNAQWNALYAFLTDKQTKILRNGSGQILYVDTSNPVQEYMNQITNSNSTNPNEQPYMISFDFIEVS